MSANVPHGRSVIITTLAISMVFSIMPLPDNLQWYRPQWTALVLIYWCMALPERVGVGSGFVSGLLLDILTGTLLGQHAFGLSVVAFLATQTHQRIRVFPLWQQSIHAWVLLMVDQLLLQWINGTIELASQWLHIWLPPLIGALLWPWVFIILRDLRRRFRVT